MLQNPGMVGSAEGFTFAYAIDHHKSVRETVDVVDFFTVHYSHFFTGLQLEQEERQPVCDRNGRYQESDSCRVPCSPEAGNCLLDEVLTRLTKHNTEISEASSPITNDNTAKLASETLALIPYVNRAFVNRAEAAQGAVSGMSDLSLSAAIFLALLLLT